MHGGPFRQDGSGSGDGPGDAERVRLGLWGPADDMFDGDGGLVHFTETIEDPDDERREAVAVGLVVEEEAGLGPFGDAEAGGASGWGTSA